MKPTVMFSYNNGKGSRVIADALDIHRLRHQHSKFVANRTKVLLNWGGRTLSNVRGQFGVILNHPQKLHPVINKLTFFQRSKGAFRVPDWTTSDVTAEQWLTNGYIVVERHSLEGQAGVGIRIVKRGEQIQEAPLYTRYINKQAEYRLHIVNSKVIFKQQKVKRDEQVRDAFIRSLHNGYIFREKVKDNVPKDVDVQALAAMNHFGLDFGAVDVIRDDQTAYVLEINSAPGIDPNSRLKDAYAEAFRNMIGD